jgi:hypothetical protein
MQHLAHKRTMRHPQISDDEMADYLALAENFQNFAQWRTARRGKAGDQARTGAMWAIATVVILALLTAILIAGIAITV